MTLAANNPDRSPVPSTQSPPTRRFNRRFTLILLTATAIYFAIGFYLSNLILTPPPRRTTEISNQALRDGWGYNQDSLMSLLGTPREVEFASVTPGLTLRGSLYAGRDSAACGLVMAHGITENRANMAKYASLLRDCGCYMLLYDHRGHGASDGDALSGGYYESEDVLQAERFLAKAARIERTRIGLIGESWGAAAVLLAAAKNDSVAFVLAESPYTSWRDAIVERSDKQFGKWVRTFMPGMFLWVRLRTGARAREAAPLAYVSRIRIPTLITHSAADTFTSPKNAVLLGEALDSTLGKAVLLDWGAWHAHNALKRPAEFKALVSTYFTQKGAWPCEQ